VGNWKKKDPDLGKGISESGDHGENGLVLTAVTSIFIPIEERL